MSCRKENNQLVCQASVYIKLKSRANKEGNSAYSSAFSEYHEEKMCRESNFLYYNLVLDTSRFSANVDTNTVGSPKLIAHAISSGSALAKQYREEVKNVKVLDTPVFGRLLELTAYGNQSFIAPLVAPINSAVTSLSRHLEWRRLSRATTSLSRHLEWRRLSGAVSRGGHQMKSSLCFQGLCIGLKTDDTIKEKSPLTIRKTNTTEL